MVAAVKREMGAHGLTIASLKNRFMYPTALGYSDLNCAVKLILPDGTAYLAEVQLNHPEMVEAKESAHKDYEKIRRVLPELCAGTGVDVHRLEQCVT